MSEATGKKRALFLCTGNSCRSQMAEGLLRQIAAQRFQAASAGTSPKPIHPLAVRVMGEAGIDISHNRSKPVDEMLDQKFDYVITVCDKAREACPVFSGDAKKLHWSFEDPAEAAGTLEERLAAFRRVRDQIARKVRDFAFECEQAMMNERRAAIEL